MAGIGFNDSLLTNFGIVFSSIGFSEIPGRERIVHAGALAKIDLSEIAGGANVLVTDGPVVAGIGFTSLSHLVKDISPPASGRIRFNEQVGAFLAVVKPGGETDSGGIGFTEEAGAAIADSVTAGVTAGIGFDDTFTRINDLFEVGIEAGLGLGEITGKESEKLAGVDADLGFSEAIEKELTTNPSQDVEGITFSITAGALNYSAFLRAKRGELVYRYYARITGGPDGLEDYEFPAFKSFSTRLRSESPSYLSIVVPYTIEVLTALNERTNGQLVVDMEVSSLGLEPLREELIRTEFDNARKDRGGESQSITITGYKTHNFYGGAAVLENVVSESENTDGTLRYRCASPDFYLKPGQVASYGPNQFTVGSVSCLVGVNSQYMDVAE